jgi:RNase P subunit RPR2
MENNNCIYNVNGNTLITTTERELGKYEFFCKKCKKLHTMSTYAIAQLTMGNELIFSCTCGEKITLEPF